MDNGKKKAQTQDKKKIEKKEDGGKLLKYYHAGSRHKAPKKMPVGSQVLFKLAQDSVSKKSFSQKNSIQSFASRTEKSGWITAVGL